MDLKSILKNQYSCLVDNLTSLEKGGEQTREENVHMLKMQINQLSDLVDMLAFIDETVPLLKCQVALGKLNKDLLGLYLNYLEERLIRKDPSLYDQHRDMEAILAMEEAAEIYKYQPDIHQLYINTVHATGRLIAEHIDALNENELRVRISDYFRNLVEVGLEHFDRSNFDDLDGLIKELNNNFALLRKVEGYEDWPLGDQIQRSLSELSRKMQHRILFFDTIKKLTAYGYGEDLLDEDLKAKIKTLEGEIIGSRNQFESTVLKLVSHLPILLWGVSA